MVDGGCVIGGRMRSGETVANGLYEGPVHKSLAIITGHGNGKDLGVLEWYDMVWIWEEVEIGIRLKDDND